VRAISTSGSYLKACFARIKLSRPA
jgi:hypothetical protein